MPTENFDTTPTRFNKQPHHYFAYVNKQALFYLDEDFRIFLVRRGCLAQASRQIRDGNSILAIGTKLLEVNFQFYTNKTSIWM